jgi:arrestin-related trafficking adapter 4/5/7
MALRSAMTSREHRHSQSHNDLSSLASGSSLSQFASHSRLFPFTEIEHHNKDPKLEIHLDADVVKLRGVGVDVEPARLSGHVVLQLAERTSIKEITLQFKGKARLPAGPAES